MLASRPVTARDAGTLRFEILPTYMTGDFGSSQNVDLLYVPAVLKYQRPRSEYRLTVPYLRVSAQDPNGLADVRFFQTSAGGARSHASGLGDVVLHAEGFIMTGTPRRPWLSLTGRIKFPTAERGVLGTGQADYGAGVSAIQQHGAWSFFGSAEYNWIGDPPGIDYRNVMRYDAGAGVAAGRSSLLYLSWYRRDSIIRGRAAIEDVALGWDLELSEGVKLRTTLYHGLSDTAEDTGVTLGLSFRAGS